MNPVYPMTPIGMVRSCYGEKFGIPRQAGLVPQARAQIALLPPWNRPEAVRGLEGFSHIWILFVFHEARAEEPKLTVRPPRLGGNERVGVFASRSPFRPNPIGMSPVRLDEVAHEPDGPVLHVSGIDLLDGTPILDIKPYVPYADAIPDAAGGFATEAPEANRTVDFAPAARAACARHEAAGLAGLTDLILAVLRHDPRPAYRGEREEPDRVYGTILHGLNVRWTVAGTTVRVIEIVPAG